MSQKTTELNEKLQSCVNKLLEAGQDARESERESRFRETINTLKKIFPGVHGRIVDLVRPSSSRYDLAVMTILGRHIDSIVVDTEKTAIECVQYLRNQRAGLATFLPLDTLQNLTVNDKYRSFAQGARLAIDCVQFDATLEKAIHNVCGSALICDSMDIAKHVCYERDQEVKAVTLDGTVIHRSGLITGGQSTHKSSRRWDNETIEGVYSSMSTSLSAEHYIALKKKKASLMSELKELEHSSPNSTHKDEHVTHEIHRLETALVLIQDELV